MADNMNLKEATNASMEFAKNKGKELENAFHDGIETSKENVFQLTADVVQSFSGEDIAQLGNAAGSAAIEYLRQKIENIKEGFRNKTPVEIRSLIGEVSPYVQDPVTAFQAMTEKIDSLTRYILGVGSQGTLAEAIGDQFLQYMTEDKGVQDALANLGAVKVYADLLNTASDAIAGAQRVMRIVEPYVPIIEVAARLFSAVRTQNAADSQEALLKAQEEVTKLSQQLTTLLLGSFRRYVYSLKVEVPNIVLGAMNTISVRDAVLQSDWSNGWLKSVFDEDFYDQTMYSYIWEDSWNKTIRDTLGSQANLINNWAEFNFVDSKGNPITRGEFMKSKFMNTFTQNFLKQAVATARKNAYIRTYNDVFWSRPHKSEGKFDVSPTSDADSRVNLLTDIMNSNLMDMSPFTSTGSIRTLSKQMVDRYN